MLFLFIATATTAEKKIYFGHMVIDISKAFHFASFRPHDIPAHIATTLRMRNLAPSRATVSAYHTQFAFDPRL